MKIAILNPIFLLGDQDKNFNGYNYIFLKKYCEIIYCIDLRRISSYKKILKKIGLSHIKVTASVRKLNESADVLVSFCGMPYKLQYSIPKKFNGMKIVHIMDYVFGPQKTERALVSSGVEYIMGYCNHGNECEFFRKYYHYREEEIIKVPFGYGSRFGCQTPFEKRINKAIALGSVNPVKDEYYKKEVKALTEYAEFYSEEMFTHKLRRKVVENREQWKQQIDDELPTYPETKNFNYDAVVKLNEYKMFINDAGLMNFPPARTYEGIACGTVMVAEDLEVYKELGFVDGQNCILFSKGNYEEMIKKIQYYQENEDELFALHLRSLELSKKYSHEIIAENLYENIRSRYDKYKVNMIR